MTTPDDRGYIQFNKHFGNDRKMQVTIPDGSQALSPAEVDEMVDLLQGFVDMLVEARDAAKRKLQ